MGQTFVWIFLQQKNDISLDPMTHYYYKFIVSFGEIWNETSVAFFINIILWLFRCSSRNGSNISNSNFVKEKQLRRGLKFHDLTSVLKYVLHTVLILRPCASNSFFCMLPFSSNSTPWRRSSVHGIFSVAVQIQTPLHRLILCFQSENPDGEDVNGFWPYRRWLKQKCDPGRRSIIQPFPPHGTMSQSLRGYEKVPLAHGWNTHSWKKKNL